MFDYVLENILFARNTLTIWLLENKKNSSCFWKKKGTNLPKSVFLEKLVIFPLKKQLR